MQDSERPDPPARAGDDREFFIGRLRVRVARGLLESPDGKRIQLEPRVMQVLVKLASRPGEVMTRRDLEDSVWPGMVVSDDALNRCIYHLRHALDALLDGTDSGPPVETLRKRGYRLRLPVHAAGHDPVTASPQLGDEAALDPSTRGRGSGRGVLLAAAVLCIALIVGHGVLRDGAPPSSTPTSVAVLPFLNLTGDPALEVVADGFAEQLLHDLVSVPGLRVAART
ncbi:MAG: winged helix-turn-helix domain-containing protein, partial [Wenzhouxiangellaceae bacterium]